MFKFFVFFTLCSYSLAIICKTTVRDEVHLNRMETIDCGSRCHFCMTHRESAPGHLVNEMGCGCGPDALHKHGGWEEDTECLAVGSLTTREGGFTMLDVCCTKESC
ncbi:unnamed protein product, partial [Mesorhabditis belari]|uniref:Uncharacterized protein n=1 Tax=Mesorhabditis belari TaxID=2138241 RepID=A0AAF3FQ07_9BILA